MKTLLSIEERRKLLEKIKCIETLCYLIKSIASYESSTTIDYWKGDLVRKVKQL